ncbi:MAG: helix-turn-helix domain-containing protein [Spirochaetota bacterium]
MKARFSSQVDEHAKKLSWRVANALGSRVSSDRFAKNDTTLRDLAERSGVSKSWISRASMRHNNVSLERLMALAEYLKIRFTFRVEADEKTSTLIADQS